MILSIKEPGQTIGTNDVRLWASIDGSRCWAEADRALQGVHLLPKFFSFSETFCASIYLIWLSNKDVSSALKSIR